MGAAQKTCVTCLPNTTQSSRPAPLSTLSLRWWSALKRPNRKTLAEISAELRREQTLHPWFQMSKRKTYLQFRYSYVTAFTCWWCWDSETSVLEWMKLYFMLDSPCFWDKIHRDATKLVPIIGIRNKFYRWATPFHKAQDDIPNCLLWWWPRRLIPQEVFEIYAGLLHHMTHPEGGATLLLIFALP